MELSERFVFRCAAWPSKLFGMFESMKRKGECCDVILKFENRSISAHRVILFAAFPHFKEIFGNQTFGSSGREVAVSEVEPSALESLIDFAYSCQLEITNDNVRDLLSAALQLKADVVQEACFDFIRKRINSQNVMYMLEIAETLDCSTLREKCLCFLRANFDELSAAGEILCAPFSLMKELISGDELNTSSEEKVYEAVINWKEQDRNRRKECLPELLSHIRLTFLKLDYLRHRVLMEEDIRTSLECRDIIDEVNFYHLSKRKNELNFLETRPRKRIRLDPKFSIYAISKNVSLRLQHLNTDTNKWETVESAPYEAGTGTVVCNDGVIYFVDAESVRSCTIEGAKWNGHSRFMVSRLYASTAVLNKKLYVCGGRDAKDCLNEVLCLDLEKNENVDVPPMCEKRFLPGVVALGQYLFVLGGHNGQSSLQSVERYDPCNNMWTTWSPMKIDRYGMGCCSYEGKIYVCGGRSSSIKAILNTVEVYDPSKNQWEYISPMKMARVHLSLVSDGGRLFAVGGCSENLVSLNSVEIFDPQTNEWKFGPNMNPTEKYVRAVSIG